MFGREGRRDSFRLCRNRHSDRVRRRVGRPALFSAWAPPKQTVIGTLFYGDGSDGFMAVQEGKFWRVEITWPNGVLHYFGKFASKQAAIEWIAAHSWWLTAPATDEAIGEPSITDQVQGAK
jgi:hypothetical protein